MVFFLFNHQRLPFHYPFSKLSIVDFRIWVHLGCTEQEKHHPQPVRFDIDFIFKTPPNGTVTDRLEDTVCYFQMIEKIKSHCQKRTFNLIEYLTTYVSQIIHEHIKEHATSIESIHVTVNKLSPPIQDIHGGVSFTYCTALSPQET